MPEDRFQWADISHIFDMVETPTKLHSRKSVQDSLCFTHG